MKLEQLIKSTNIPAKLVRNVVKQSGGWDSFKEVAEDISRYGVDGGFGGWTYYTDTVAFWIKNKKEIMETAEQQASDFGQGTLEMIASFGCMKTAETNINELAKLLYGSRGDKDIKDVVYNCMAWYAAEEVARAYCDLLER